MASEDIDSDFINDEETIVRDPDKYAKYILDNNTNQDDLNLDIRKESKNLRLA